MKILLILLLGFGLNASLQAQTAYDALLGKYASEKGVRYAAWKANAKDTAELGKITTQFASTDPSKLPRDEQLAFYINAYNAWTLKNVLDAYPIKSIRDVYPLFGFFSRKTITVAGEKMSLNKLEKEIIIARFHEPRIHTAINCASRSCPELAGKSYTAAKLDSQLDAGFSKFVNENPLGVTIANGGKSVAVSSIFKWYAADFEPKGGAFAFINNFRKEKLSPNLPITYQDYDWNLNEAK